MQRIILSSYLVPATLPSAFIRQVIHREKKDSERSKDGGHTGCESLERWERELELKQDDSKKGWATTYSL
jgi:hypothetical protein